MLLRRDLSDCLQGFGFGSWTERIWLKNVSSYSPFYTRSLMIWISVAYLISFRTVTPCPKFSRIPLLVSQGFYKGCDKDADGFNGVFLRDYWCLKGFAFFQDCITPPDPQQKGLIKGSDTLNPIFIVSHKSEQCILPRALLRPYFLVGLFGSTAVSGHLTDPWSHAWREGIH